MKTNPLVYILIAVIGIVALLMSLANVQDDDFSDSQTTSSEPSQSPGYPAEDSDSPSEAVKAVGSQINALRKDQSAFKEQINQTVSRIHNELQTLHGEIRKLANRQNSTARQINVQQTNIPERVGNRQPDISKPGDEPIAPYHEKVPDYSPSGVSTQPAWLWIEDQSVITPDDDGSEHLAGGVSEYLDIDAISAIAASDDEVVAHTIPPATVIQGVTLTAAIGRLPVRGQLNEPWPIKVISTMEGYAPNGYAVDAARMIWDGRAFGDANFECVRVVLTRVTAVLPGKVVSFVEASDSEKGLGYLSDAYGHPCLKGKLVSNAAKQMTAEAILGIAQGIGEGYADTQRTRTVSPEGNTIERVTGEEVRVLIGQGFARSVGNVRNYLASRYDVWDAIYVPPEREVVINVDQPLEFIYDSNKKLYDVSAFAFKVGDDTGTRLD